MIELPKDPKKRHSLAMRMCFGKIKHKSFLSAEYTLSQLKGKESHLLEIYNCPFCKTFHIGHNRKKGQDELENI